MLDEDEFIYDKQINDLTPRIHYIPFKKHSCHLGGLYVLYYF